LRPLRFQGVEVLKTISSLDLGLFGRDALPQHPAGDKDSSWTGLNTKTVLLVDRLLA